ncbi:hypothetical protein [Clostridium butyricum]|uniref:hypothetical protein n=1 Tax=Clostridium butyricum TaxID=1492 RepID=UPI00374F4CAE
MSSKNDKADVYIQGRYYKPENIDEVPDENEIREDRPIGSNPYKKRDENAFCKYIDAIIETGKLYSNGILVAKRIGANFYDDKGNIIKKL